MPSHVRRPSTDAGSFLPISRRGFMRGAAVAGLAATMPLTRAAWAQQGKILTARAYADIDKLDPGFYQNAYNVDVMNLIYPKLIGYNPGREWGWQLQGAESIEQVDPTHIRFKLRPGIMWTGGFGETTAEDVKFSYERILEHDSPIKGDWGPLEGVEVEDTYTGVIVLSEPFQPIWNITLPYGAGHIVSKEAVLSTGGTGDFGMTPPAFAGPYVIAEWRPNEALILKRNELWDGPAPGFEEIRILPIEDEKTAEIAFEAGDVDFTGISLSSLENLQANPPAEAEIEVYPSLYYSWLGMNTEHPKLEDINVRRAIQWAVNVPQILEAAYFGQAEPATGIIAPGLVGHRARNNIPPEGDLEKAREFLAQAGSVPDSLKLAVLNSEVWRTAGQVIQAQLGQLGINVELDVHEPGSFWTLGMEAEGERWKDLEMILNRFSMVPDPYYGTEWFTCEQVGIWNWERFCSERFDELHKLAAAETVREKRDDMYIEMQNIMEDSGAYRFITHEASPIMYRQTVTIPAVRPDGAPLYRYFEAV